MTNYLSLDLARELWNKGLRLENTKLWWCLTPMTLWHIIDIEGYSCIRNTPGYYFFPAPSTDELLEVLPDRLPGLGVLKIYKFPNEYEVTYASIYPQVDKCLTEAIGKTCLWLLDNGWKYEDGRLNEKDKV